jgi:integrase
MSARGDGVFEAPRGSGRWYYALRIPVVEQARPRQMKRGVYGTRRDAVKMRSAVITLLGRAKTEDAKRRLGSEVWRSTLRGSLPTDEAVAQVNLGVDPDDAAMPVNAWLDRYLRDKTWKTDATTGTTRGAVESRFDIWVRSQVGGVPLNELRGWHLDDLFRQIREGGALQPSSQAQVFAFLRGALNAARRRRLITFNPCDEMLSPPNGKAPERPVWTAAQVGLFLRANEGDRMHAAWRLVLVGGLRASELCGLRWSDLDDGRLRVERQLQYLGKAGTVETPPKSERGHRTIDLDLATLRALDRHRTAQKRERLQAGVAWQGPEPADGYVFRREDGRPIIRPWLTRTWRQLAKGSGLPIIRLHDLRHTSITAGLAAGVDPMTMQERAGHSNLAVTRGYMHRVAELHARAGDKIGALFDDGTQGATRDA